MANLPGSSDDSYRPARLAGIAIGLASLVVAVGLALAAFVDFRALGSVGSYVAAVRDFIGRPIFSAAVALLLLVFGCSGALAVLAVLGLVPRHDGSWSAPPRDLPFHGESLDESGWRILLPTSHVRLSSDAIKTLRRRCVRLSWLVGLAAALVIGAGVIRYAVLHVTPTHIERSRFMTLVFSLILLSVFFSPALTTWLDLAAFLRRNAAWSRRERRDGDCPDATCDKGSQES